MEKIGLFKIISVHFGSVSQNVLKLILKSPGFVPFVANLTHFEAKPTIPGLGCVHIIEHYIYDVNLLDCYLLMQEHLENVQDLFYI